jgi:O-antigen/teichoic acid export membrane protein
VGLKEKTVNGLAWSFIGDIADKAIAFIIGVILARLLTPREYGLVGMVTIFIVLTRPFINSGFRQALIRKTNCTNTDYSTVFYFNFLIGILAYFILFFCAPSIAAFFKEPQLVKITRLIGLIIIIDAATIIQTTILFKEINFKRQTAIIITSEIISGVLGIYLAYKGYGVWSLVYRTLAQYTMNSGLLWYLNRWRPSTEFSFTSFKELFGFGSNLLLTGIIEQFYYNIYNLVIAKFFSARQLGLYTRADMFKNLASTNLSEVIGRVLFPVLANFQDDPERLAVNYKKILTTIIFVTSILMVGMAASARALVLTLIGGKWVESIPYLQLLCFVGIFYPLHALTRTLLYVCGKGRLFLYLQIFSKLLTIPAIIIGIFFGIKAMIVGMIVAGGVEYLVKAFYSGRIVNYSVLSQLKDLIPIIMISVFIGISVYLLVFLPINRPWLILILQVFCGITLTVGLSKIFKIPEYILIKEITRDKVKEFLRGNFKND